MKTSILRNILFAYLSFGILMGVIFPFYADFFVEWKEGMYLWFVLGCLLAGIMMGIFTYIIMKIVLVKKLENIAVCATAISNKDLTYSCSMQSDDVIGTIINSFTHMSDSLSDIIANLQVHCRDIQASVREVAGVAADSAQSTDMQFQEVQNIQSSIDHLQQSIALIAENTGVAMSLSNETTDNVNAGNQIIHQTKDVIAQLSNNFHEASKTIDELKLETENIGSVLSAIQDISEQTNLLALNAAIEAARAGEQGRGFAVVADEVRTLAKRTHDSTHEIQTMIESLQKGALSAVTLMKRSTTDAEKGVEIIAKADGSFNLINSAMTEMNEKNQQIQEASEEQLDAVNGIHENIKNVGLLTANSQEGAEGSATESDKLRHLADELVNIFEGFKLKEESLKKLLSAESILNEPVQKIKEKVEKPKKKKEVFSDDDNILF